jgi:hypothetical protein
VVAQHAKGAVEIVAFAASSFHCGEGEGEARPAREGEARPAPSQTSPPLPRPICEGRPPAKEPSYRHHTLVSGVIRRDQPPSQNMKESQLIGNILSEYVAADDLEPDPLAGTAIKIKYFFDKFAAAAKAELAAHRSSSAPPTLLESAAGTLPFLPPICREPLQTLPLLFLRSASAVLPPQFTVVHPDLENLSPGDPRLDPGYYTYYYSQRPLDPRLPPPLILPWTRYPDQEEVPGQGKGSLKWVP